MSGKRHSRRRRAERITRPRYLRFNSLEHLEERRLLAADLHDTSLAPAAEFAPAVAGAGAAIGISANLAAINVPQAWAAGHTGRGVVVAVVDSGIALDHPGLTASLWTNPGEVPGNGADDDGNGFVDDVAGWDFVGRDNRPDDPNGHGTHVAGTIAGGGEIRGVAPEARLLPVRVLDSSIRGSNANIAAGIRYAVDAGADVINLSVGGPDNAAVRSALEYARQHDVLVVAAAGNTKGAAPMYPAAHSASLPNVLSVGAFGNSGALAQFSSRVAGSGAVQVDAPGQDIRSTFVAAPYGFQSGTSMAAPHVSGLAALALAANPALTALELRNLIVQGARRSVPGSDARGGIDAANTLALVMAGRTTPEEMPPAAAEPAEILVSPASQQEHVVESDSTAAPLDRSTQAKSAVSRLVHANEVTIRAPGETESTGSPPVRARLVARANVHAELAQQARDRVILSWQQRETELWLAPLQHWSQRAQEASDADWFEQHFGLVQLSFARRTSPGFTFVSF